ncbi:MAG: nuclear transport factor 2 family protein [Ilumatobacter sp.]|uniref:nuclear transport factor 2 family protein n=1 Tax=Ilumatobacter sp. TaxID=1967498 RepID=UPI00329767EA
MSVSDRLAVAETVYRYATGIDMRDFELYRSIFAPEVAIDFSSYSDRAPATVTADQWVASVVPLFTGLDATQHSMTNPIAEIDGDDARCRMYMQAHHVYRPEDPTSWFTIGGYYDDTLVRSELGPVGWLVTGVTLTVLWRRGDAGIMPAAAAHGRAVSDAGS